MNVDPEGTAWWHWVLGALAVVAVTALTVVTCGAAAVALGASAAVVAGVMAGAAVGGLVVGGANLISQGLTGDGSVDFGSLVSSTFIGGVVGGVIGGFAGAAPGIIGALNTPIFGGLAYSGGGAAVLSSMTVGQAVVAGGAIAGVIGTYVLSRNSNNNLPMHGTPNSVVARGHSEGQYDGNGNLMFRKDYNFHNGYNPHTHVFKWDLINGAWRIIRKYILPF